MCSTSVVIPKPKTSINSAEPANANARRTGSRWICTVSLRAYASIRPTRRRSGDKASVLSGSCATSAAAAIGVFTLVGADGSASSM